jgi:hypothetical protein
VANITEYYAIVNLESVSVYLVSLTHPEEIPEPPPDLGVGYESILLTLEVVGAVYAPVFLDLYIPLVVDGQVTEWEAIPAAPSLSIDLNPLSDGSNVSTISLTGGVASAGFKLEYSHPITTDLLSNVGSFDGSGAAEFKIQVYGLGDLILDITPVDVNAFLKTSFQVTVDAPSLGA